MKTKKYNYEAIETIISFLQKIKKSRGNIPVTIEKDGKNFKFTDIIVIDGMTENPYVKFFFGKEI